MFFNESQSQNAKKIEYLIVGLGNPGKEYERTRHNCGYMALDYLAEAVGANINKLKFKSLVGECEIENKRCLLMKPTTYMNNSGIAVKEAMKFYKIPPKKVIIIFDDISLDVGKMRIKRKGSSGGQNGIKNIIYLTGSEDFPRIKIGIGKKPHPDYDLKDWVLSRFNDKDSKAVGEVLKNVDNAVKLIINDKIDEAMNLYN